MTHLRLELDYLATPEQRLIEGMSFSASPGSPVALMGPSGCGKSSVLAFIAGFLAHPLSAKGQVLLDDVDVGTLPAERRRMGLLFQDPLLFPHMSVAQNLAFGMPRDKASSDKRQDIETALQDAGLGGFSDRDPAALSGGQKARVALLRTLLSQPKALLLDEPFSKLDAGLRKDFQAFVMSQAEALSIPVLLVTHDIQDAERLGGQTLVLNKP